jgi:hypothetical protein
MPDTLISEFFFSDESLNKEITSACRLALQVSDEWLYYSVLHDALNKYLALGRLPLEAGTPDDQAARLAQSVSKNKWLRQPYFSVSIILESPKSTLIPEALADTDRMGQYLQFNHPVNDNEDILTDWLLNLQAFNIYAYPATTVIQLKELWSAARLSHLLSSLIEVLLIRFKHAGGGDRVYANVRPHWIDVVNMLDNRLVFCNSFRYTSTEDLLYYLIFVYEQLKLNPEKVPLILMGEIDRQSAVTEQLSEYLRYVGFIGRNEDFHYSAAFDTIPEHYFYNLLNLPLCEL